MVQVSEQCFIHPGSTCFGEGDWSSTWLVFNEKVQTSRLWLRDASAVPPYALLLFGGAVRVQHQQGTVTIDDYVRSDRAGLATVMRGNAT